MPSLIYKACLATGTQSNTRYAQLALCEALSRDLGIPLEDLLAELPPTRGPAAHLFDPADGSLNRFLHRHAGPANTIEEVR